ncbi:MAG: adenosine kinase [Bdellovibrionales bacterium]
MVIRSLPQKNIEALYDICAIGNAIVDVLASCEDTFLEDENIAKGGMTLIDEARAKTLYGKIRNNVEMSGGSAANTAAGIASLGGHPAYIGKVKNDSLGRIYRQNLREVGVHFDSAPLQNGPATAQCIILVTPDAQRSMNTYLGACTELTPADIDVQIVANAKVTYLEGYLYDKPSAKEAFHIAAHIVHEADRHLALSLSDSFCVDRHRDDFKRLICDEVDFLLANEKELCSLYETDTFEDALAQAAEQCSVTVGTRSEKGAVIMAEGTRHSISAYPVKKVVDTTGAGDLFAAGFLYGITHDCDFAESGRLGALAAGEVISHYGPRPQQELKELTMKSQELNRDSLTALA